MPLRPGPCHDGAHAPLLARGLDCTLDRRPRRVPCDERDHAARARPSALSAQAQGLDFVGRVDALTGQASNAADGRTANAVESGLHQLRRRARFRAVASRHGNAEAATGRRPAPDRRAPTTQAMQAVDETPRPSARCVGAGHEHRRQSSRPLRKHVDRVGACRRCGRPSQAARRRDSPRPRSPHHDHAGQCPRSGRAAARAQRPGVRRDAVARMLPPS